MTQKLQNPQYDTWSASRSHFHSNGLAMMPTAGEFAQAAQVVALHGGLDWEIIAWFATRRGEPPVIPSPISRNKNRVYLGGGRTGEFPIKDMGGVTGYAVAGWFIFGILAPEGLNSDFMLGNLPFSGLVSGLDTNEFIPASYFRQGLINDKTTQTETTVPSLPPLIMAIKNEG